MVTVTNAMLASPAVRVLVHLMTTGTQLRLAGTHVFVSPSAALTSDHRKVLRQHRSIVQAIVPLITDPGVRARVLEFREQFETTTAPAVPAFIFHAGLPYVAGSCFSCGAVLDDVRFGRCWRCALAWRFAVEPPISPALALACDEARVV